MKNYIKKLLAILLVCTMIIPMGLISSFAMEADTSVTDNWNTMAAKYSRGTWGIIAPRKNNYAITTDGFTFNETSDGGIKVVTPDYATFNGTYAVSAVTGNATTALDGLSVVITPDEFDSLIDSTDTGNTIGILWTEEKIDSIATFNDTTKSYDKGIYTAVRSYGTGLRTLIPTVDGAPEMTPASDPAATPNGQALYISVTCNVEAEGAAPVANSVKICWYDGYYINNDGNPGYRWSFTARNNPNTTNSDATRLSKDWEYVDLSDGLAVSIRADEEHGYIITVNGYDYYKAEDIGYFPDARYDWYGYKTGDLTDDKIEEMDPYYLQTMTYARQDLDLRGLTSAGEGYLTIGAISNNDQKLTVAEGAALDHHCNYTVNYINGVPAAQWNGQKMAEDHECVIESLGAKAPTCLREGADVYWCKICGKYTFENKVPATGHTEGEYKCFEEPACDNYGTMASHCTVCRSMVRSAAIPKIPHTYETDWTVAEAASCDKDGKQTNVCVVCANTVEEAIPATGHTYEWVVTTEPNCGTEGIETETCTTCGATGETRTVPANGDAHVCDSWTPVVETVDGSTDWYGKEVGNCSICNAETERTVDMTEYVRHFTDVKLNQWYMSEVAYCVKQGYVSGMTETTFAPNKNLTRAQFLTLLAKVDGVDLSQYDNAVSSFTDVKAKSWFKQVVAWAVENEYTSGVSKTKFGPNDNITREQLARFFYVYTEKKGYDVSARADLSAFTDAGKISKWAKENVEWAVSVGLITGMTATTIGPKGNATRAQAARMIMLYTALDLAPTECAHEWGEWVVTVEPTYTEVGSQTKTCALCGETETEELPKKECEHAWGEWVVTVKPTYTTVGSQTRTCSECGATETEELPTYDWKITFDPMDGTMPEGVELEYGINTYDNYKEATGIEYPVPTLDGYDFMGWYWEPYSYTLDPGTWDNGYFAVSCDVYLEALWEESAPELPLYDENANPEALAVGTADYALSAEYQYTLFELEPTEKGLYTITANDSLVGIVSYNGMWVTITPDATTVTESSVEWECGSVGQAIWVAVKGSADTANITVTAGEAAPDPVINRIEYTNVHTPVAFTFDGDAAALTNVAYKNDTVDTAVLGEDGLYHLGTVDGPVLYVNLADSKMNLTDAMGYGQLKHAATVDNVTTITDYNNAYAEYIACADALTNLYPLTEDLMVILQEVGANQGWYIEGGWIATTEDAWMFPCYYIPAAEPEAVEFTLVFDVAGDETELEHGAIVNDAALEYTITVGDKYADSITELPVAEKEGYVFKGWWNRERRIAITPDFDAEKVFDVYLGNDENGDPETVETIDTTITLIPIWDTEGAKDCSVTFENCDVEDFEPITYEMNVGDYYMSIFAGDFPDPQVYQLDEWTEFVGWYIEELNFLLTEGDMWDLGYLALEGHWTLVALYQEV